MDQLLSLSWWFSFFDQTWTWWLAVEVIGLVFLPLVMLWFRAWPDRGIGLAPALGVLITAYTAWVWSFSKSGKGMAGLLAVAVAVVLIGLLLQGEARKRFRPVCFALAAPFVLGCLTWVHGGFTVLVVLVVWAGIGVALLWKNGAVVWREFRRRWVLWAAVQILFTVGFLFFSNVRSYIPYATYEPGMSGAEKFDNFAHLNGVMRAEHMPPQDVWWAGKSINYYYGGHLITATVAKLVGKPAAIAFNLGLAMVFALTLTSGFSLAFNLVNRLARLWRPTWGVGWEWLRTPLWVKGMGWGLLGAVAIALFGNLDAWTQALSRDLGPLRAQYDRVYQDEIKKRETWKSDLETAQRAKNKAEVKRLKKHPRGLAPAKEISDLGLRLSSVNLLQVDFWRSSRMIKGSITEFPYFSAILGDHHAHHYALPFSILAYAAAAGLLRKGARWKGRRTVVRWLATAWPELLAMAFLIGAILPINSWDVIILVPVYLLAVLVGMAGLTGERGWRWAIALGAYVFFMMAAALVLNARPEMKLLVRSPLAVALPIILLGVPIAIEELRPGTFRGWMWLALLGVFVAGMAIASIVRPDIIAGDVFLGLAVVGGVGLWMAFCDGRGWRWWGSSLTTYGVVGILGLAAALPFQLFFQAPFETREPLLLSKFPPLLSTGLWSAPDFWQAVWQRVPVNPTGLSPIRSQLRDYLGHWGIFWIPIVVLWVIRLVTVSRRWPRGKAFALWFGLLAITYLTFDLIRNCWVAPLTLAMSVGCLVLAWSLRRDPRGSAVWSFLTVAFFYSFFVEVLHFDDQYSGELERYNTPFKIYYPLWAPMAMGMCVMLKELVSRKAPRRGAGSAPWWRMAPWVGVLATLVIARELWATPVFWLVAVPMILVAAGFGAIQVFEPFRARNVSVASSTSDLFARLAWRIPLALGVGFLLVLGLLYPAASTAVRTSWFQNPNVIPSYQKDSPEKDTYTQRTLDATAYLGNKAPYKDDLAMIHWINANIRGQPVIVERIGDGAYQVGSRFATNTGLPTLLGWEHHELQWRGWGKTVPKADQDFYGDELQKKTRQKPKGPEMVDLTGLLRERVNTIYKAATYEEIRGLLQQHRARYVVVGSLEREAYKDSPEGLKKFDSPPFEKVSQSGQTTLYKVPE